MTPSSLSVVVPTYNRARALERTVRSVLAQEDVTVEVVVSDDGSTDDTAAVVAAIEDERVRYVSQQNAGGCAARNAGARAATHPVLAFLDDDDEVLPRWAVTLLAELTDPACAVVCCGSAHVDADGVVVQTVHPHDLGAPFDHTRGLFDTGSYLLRRQAFEDVGGFVDGLPASPHTELALRLVELCAARGWTMRAVEDALVVVHDRRASDRPRNHPSALYEGTRYILDHHGERLRRNPTMLGDYLAIAGVSAARRGEWREARRRLWAATRANPGNPKHAGRLLLATVPALGRRVWRADEFRRAEERRAAG
jgi:glycosyltransferase involved in cell wall biosynthesis